MSLWLVAALFMASPAGGDESSRLPRVLLIGDSISIGYTPYVREMLSSEAGVTRIVDPETGNNGRHTRTGLERLDRWLSDGPYDVIHFNWGLWDLCYRQHPDGGRGDKANGRLTTPLEEYEANLEALCARLEQTDAQLILATTTPVPAGEPGRFEGAAVEYNAVANRVAQKFGLMVDDLHAHIAPRMAEYQTRPNNVHFTPDGYRYLAENVARTVRSALARRDYAILRGGLGRSYQALTHGGRVAFLGGSITHNPGWRDRVGAYLERRFPGGEVELINAGNPSMGSTPGAYRMYRDARIVEGSGRSPVRRGGGQRLLQPPKRDGTASRDGRYRPRSARGLSGDGRGDDALRRSEQDGEVPVGRGAGGDRES